MKRVFVCFFVGVFLCLASGCGGSSGGGEGLLRVFHASPDAPNVDILLDGEVVLSDVPYKLASNYLRIADGDRRIQVNVTGTDTTVIDAVLAVENGQSSTVIASGFVASIQPIVSIDDRSPPELGFAKIRVGHLAPSAPLVDVYATAPGADLAGAEPVLSEVPFGVVSDYLSVPSGEYQFRVTVAGTTDVAIDSGPVTLLEGSVLTAAALDSSGGGAPFELLLLDDSLI